MQIMKIADTNHLDTSRQSPRQTRLRCFNGI